MEKSCVLFVTATRLRRVGEARLRSKAKAKSTVTPHPTSGVGGYKSNIIYIHTYLLYDA